MSFTVEDYHDLVQLILEHPDWKSELRHLLLSDELLALPEITKGLAEAQRCTEERLQTLAEAQQHTEERLPAYRQVGYLRLKNGYLRLKNDYLSLKPPCNAYLPTVR